MGYHVEAFDLSKEMAKIAAKNSGINVFSDSFQGFKTNEPYDGIWCCASLLHVHLSELYETIINLSKALSVNGAGMYHLSMVIKKE